MIKIHQLAIGYKVPLLKVEELELHDGHVYALIGANGKGKTTFLKTLNGILKPLSGSFSINGNSIQNIDRTVMSKQVAFVSSRFEGIEHLTVFQYVALGRVPFLGTFSRLKQTDLDVLNRTLETMQLTQYSNRLTCELSDGERQMAAIARALAQETPIILLDEPTAFLDYANKKKLLDTLKAISRDSKKCIVISSHDIELCLKESFEILYIDSRSQIQYMNDPDMDKIIDSCFQ